MGLAELRQDFISGICVGFNPYAWFIYGLQPIVGAFGPFITQACLRSHT